MTISYSARALDDICRIGEAIGSGENQRAARFIAGLWDACESLATMPLRYPLLPRREMHGIRRRPYGNYLIFYISDGADVTIVRVLHGARDYERLLFPAV